MSLLEDVFLQDEADEAQELERIIEGDELEDERPNQAENSDDNSEKEDEAIEDKRKVDPSSSKTKRVVKNPRVILNPARLTGPRGIQVIPEHFKDFKFKGKGHEKEDLDLVLKKLEHWAYRLYPKFQFEDCLKKIETLGKKRPVMVHLHKIRSDQLITEETVVQKDSSDEEPVQQEDEFDKLLQQQIDIARATPAPDSARKPGVTSTPLVDKRSSLMMPKATSSPSISNEQKERMMRNRKLAEERRLARMKAQNSAQNEPNGDVIRSAESDVVSESNTENGNRKNRNVINSSDDDNDEPRVNQAISVDVHSNANENVIDITEGYQRKNKIVNNEMIDLSNIDEETVHKKKSHNKSNVIESSDDEVDDVSEIEQVGGENVRNIDIPSKNNIDREIVDVDVNERNIKNKQNKSNVIDSSDDDDVEISRVDQTITADVHDSVRNTEDEKVMDVEATESVELDDVRTNIDGIQVEDRNKHSKSSEDLNNKAIDNAVENANEVELDDNNSVNTENNNSKQINTQKIQDNLVDKENVDNNVLNLDVDDDLMDVDFSEDF